MKIFVARDSPEVSKGVTALHRRGLMGFFGINRGAPRHIQTYYYPYYFQSWKVSIQKSLRRTAKVQVVTGVNGLSRSTGPADRWPVGEEVQVDQEGEEIIFPRTSETEAAELMEEYLGRFVNRRYRPVRPPEVNKGKFALIYVPYYVYAREGQPIHRAVLVEGLTGTVGRVKDVPEIAEEVTSTPLQPTAYREGQLR